jgi:hypothetical protein
MEGETMATIPMQRQVPVEITREAQLYVSLGGDAADWESFRKDRLTIQEVLGMLPNDWARGRLCLKLQEKERQSVEWLRMNWSGSGIWWKQPQAVDAADAATMYGQWATMYFASHQCRQNDQIIALLSSNFVGRTR